MNAIAESAVATVAKIQVPTLADGELYAGALVDKEGVLTHVILLPGENIRASWSDQLAWAKSVGGDLPTRLEQALLFQNLRDQFEEAYYWSNQEDTDDSGWAWCQYFNDGHQLSGHKVTALRARAVRRLIAQ